MLRRFVPSLATEMHLTIRLLHVHSDVARSCGGKTSTLEHDRQESPPSSSLTVDSIVDRVARKESLDNSGGKSETKVVFRTGMDCRSFAVQVLRGLKSLLPHLGTDTLDLLAGSLALASQVKYRCPSRATACHTVCAGGVYAFAVLQSRPTSRTCSFDWSHATCHFCARIAP